MMSRPPFAPLLLVLLLASSLSCGSSSTPDGGAPEGGAPDGGAPDGGLAAQFCAGCKAGELCVLGRDGDCRNPRGRCVARAEFCASPASACGQWWFDCLCAGDAGAAKDPTTCQTPVPGCGDEGPLPHVKCYGP